MSADPLPSLPSSSFCSSTENVKLGGLGLSNAYEPPLTTTSGDHGGTVEVDHPVLGNEITYKVAEIKAELSKVELDRKH